MTPPIHEIVFDLLGAGMSIQLDADSEHVCIRGNTSELTGELKAAILARKPELLAALRELPQGCWKPTLCLALGACPRHDVGQACSEENGGQS